MLAEALTASRVDFSLAPRSDRPTTLAFVTLTDGHAQYAFYDENTAGRMLSEDDLPALGAETEALFFGGISLVSEPAADSYAALCAQAGERLVMIDPNIRPGFITDEPPLHLEEPRHPREAPCGLVAPDLTIVIHESPSAVSYDAAVIKFQFPALFSAHRLNGVPPKFCDVRRSH